MKNLRPQPVEPRSLDARKSSERSVSGVDARNGNSAEPGPRQASQEKVLSRFIWTYRKYFHCPQNSQTSVHSAASLTLENFFRACPSFWGNFSCTAALHEELLQMEDYPIQRR